MAVNAGLALGFAANLALGVVLATLAALVFRGYEARRARAYLAVYLGLVAANYAVDALAFIVRLVESPWTVPLRRAAIAFTFVDPSFLLLFALTLAGYRIGRGRALVVFAPAVLLLFLDFVVDTPTSIVSQWRFRHAAAAWLVAAYSVSFFLITRTYLHETHAVRRDRAGRLAFAFAVVLLARIPLASVDAGISVSAGGVFERETAITLLSLLVVVTAGAFAWASWTVPPGNRRHMRRTAARAGALLGVVALVWVLLLIPALRPGASSALYSIRWFLFVGAIVGALQQDEFFRASDAEARRFRLISNVGVLVLAATQLAAIIGGISGVELGMALLAAIVFIAIFGASTWALGRSMGATAPDVRWRRMRVYRAHLELDRDPAELARIRRRLGIDAHTAAEAEALVAMERAVPPARRGDELEEGVTVLDRYEVRRFLGVGSFGRTFLAYDPVLARDVVLKELLARWHGDEAAIEAFRREAQVALDVEHENLVRILDLERFGSGHLLVLEHLEGDTVRRILADAPLDDVEARRLADDVGAGLRALHTAGVVHADVKPDNIIRRPDGRYVLLDLGSAAPAQSGTRPGGGGHGGTDGYRAPEQRDGGGLDGRADIYGLAVTLWEARAGVRPPEGDPGEAWIDPLTQARAEDPDARFPAIDAFLDALPAI